MVRTRNNNDNKRSKRTFTGHGRDFRYEEAMELESDPKVLIMVSKFLGSADRTLDKLDCVSDWLTCKCRLHRKINCGVEGSVGCEGLEPGVHCTQVGLYNADHGACVVEPGVRINDKRVFDYVQTDGEYRPMRGKYMKGSGTAPEVMGAGYCYTHLFEDNFVVRAARLLGPLPHNHCVLRYFLVFGKRGDIFVKFTEVSEGVVHVERSDTSMSLVDVVCALIGDGNPDRRIGMASFGPYADGIGANFLPAVAAPGKEPDGSRFESFKVWAKGIGVIVPDEMAIDFYLATTQSSLLPPEQAEAKLRARKMALVGDRVMSYRVAVESVCTDVQMAGASAWTQQVSNAALAMVTRQAPFDAFFDASGLLAESKARGDLVEALVGVVCMYCGVHAAGWISVSMGCLRMKANRASRLVYSRVNGGLEQLTDLMRDFALRGGDSEEIVKKALAILEAERK